MVELFSWVPLLIAGTLTLVMTPWVIKIGKRNQWVDQPDKRKHHTQAVVRVGGVAIAIGVTAAAVASQSVGAALGLSSFDASTLSLIFGGLCFFAIGFADDVLQLPPLPRLAAQILVTCFIWSMGVRIEHLPVPFFGSVSIGWLSLPITVIWVAGVANAINWFDGLDGLAAGVGTFSSVILAITAALHGHLEITYLALSLCGATIGFLRYNLPPAKLFMGDGGSYLIGYYLATLSILGFFHSQLMSSTLAPFLILGVPIVDMTMVMAARIARGRSPLYPDRRHLHHRLLHAGCSKMFATGYIWVLSAWIGTIAILFTNLAWGGICLGMMSIILVGMTLSFAQVSKRKKNESIPFSA